MSETVREILQRIQNLPEAERLVLDQQLTQLAEAEWQHEAQVARQLARENGIDQAAIDRAVENVRRGQ